jgi:hypothetical protein
VEFLRPELRPTRCSGTSPASRVGAGLKIAFRENLGLGLVGGQVATPSSSLLSSESNPGGANMMRVRRRGAWNGCKGDDGGDVCAAMAQWPRHKGAGYGYDKLRNLLSRDRHTSVPAASRTLSK